jgi:uncharacterized protein YoxC
LKTVQENEHKASTQLKQLNIDEVNARSKKISKDIEYIVDNAPKKLDEAKKLYQDRNEKKKNIQQSGGYSKLNPGSLTKLSFS